MNVLLIGSGGREHALAWKIAQSKHIRQLYTLPGNPGTAQLGENIPGSVVDLDHIVRVAREKAIDLVIVGPEDPLALGLADRLQAAGIRVFGPAEEAARLEGSKAYAKAFMARHGIPTAAYTIFTDFEAAISFCSNPAAQLEKGFPTPRTSHPARPTSHPARSTSHVARRTSHIVLKASGLAAGKGVILPETLPEAEEALREMMVENRFGTAGDEVVIEERLVGREVSVLAFTDGETIVPMVPAQDHKRLLDGDEGPNTGGMGVFAPSPYAPPELIRDVVDNVLEPTIKGLQSEGITYRGVLYAGMILTNSGPKVLEFNCRFGDPETQAVLPLLETDLLEIMVACADGNLAEIAPDIRWKDAATVCVVLASGGYPGSYSKGKTITGVNALRENVVVFHAGTRMDGDELVTAGGRVLGVTALGPDIPAARETAYAAVDGISFKGKQYRKDISMSGPDVYAAAGVNIEAGNRAVALMKDAVKSTFSSAVLSELGAFGGLFSAADLLEMTSPVLVATTDGAGTKVALAAQAGRYRGIGQDIVNHCINDILVQGARPLFFLDYIASSRLKPEMIAEIVEGMAAACRSAGCAILGGETAEMPGVYADDHFDVVGTLVGAVDRQGLLPRPEIAPGDVLLGFPSSGPHTNGYSLIRKLFADVPLDHVYPEIGIPLADVLLAPHRSYLNTFDLKSPGLKALAHITGGGFQDNIPRILPESLGVEIDRGTWTVPAIFSLIQRLGDISTNEMFRIFNMGIGMIAVAAHGSTLHTSLDGVVEIGRVSDQPGVHFVG